MHSLLGEFLSSSHGSTWNGLTRQKCNLYRLNIAYCSTISIIIITYLEIGYKRSMEKFMTSHLCVMLLLCTEGSFSLFYTKRIDAQEETKLNGNQIKNSEYREI